jgi:hypothetical protein
MEVELPTIGDISTVLYSQLEAVLSSYGYLHAGHGWVTLKVNRNGNIHARSMTLKSMDIPLGEMTVAKIRQSAHNRGPHNPVDILQDMIFIRR